VSASNALKVDGSAVTQPVSGTVAVTQSTNPWVVGDGAGALNVIVDSGSITANAGTNLNTSALALSATQTDGTQRTRITDGTDTALVTAGGLLQVDGSGVTQPVSGSVTVSGTATVTQGTAAATAGRWPVQLTDGTDLSLVTAAGALVVDGSAVTQPISGTVTVGTFPDNEPFNIAQVSGNSVNVGPGAAGSGTQRVTTSTDSTIGTVTNVTTVGTITNTVTVGGTVAATQSGTWSTRTQDGTGNAIESATTSPAGTERGLIVRNIPSGTQTVSGSVTASGTVTANQGTPNSTANRWPTQITDGTDLALVSAGGALLIDGSATTQPISGTVAATQSGTWSSRTQDGSGNSIASAIATPGSSDRGFVVRQAPGASIVAGQQAVTGSAVALPTVSVRQVCVTHIEGGSVNTIFVGPTGVTTANGFPLVSGATACLPVDNVNDLFVIASGVGSSVAYVGVP
jgi:hypothetical protein